MTKTMLAAGSGLLLLGVIGMAYATAELSAGVAEIPEHWWSTLASAPLVAGIILAAVALRRSLSPAR
jgi:hypothetical protein